MDTLYTGGRILTMRGATPEYVEAVGVTDGRITFVGSAAEAEQQADGSTTRVDLGGRTMLPGFIDAHGHIVVAAHQLEQAWLRGEGVTNIPEMIEALKAKAIENGVKPGDWIVGAGWHPSVLAEGRYPTADELDLVSTEYPVMAIHASGHQASLNHKALEVAGYLPGCADPKGGVIWRVEGTDIPNGYIEESPLFYVRSLMPPLSADKYAPLMDRAMTQWASYGFTTASECCVGITPDDFDVIEGTLAAGPLKIDVLTYAEPQMLPKALEVLGEERVGSYVDGLRLGGIKLFLDGSLGGATAWVTQPYVGMEGQPNDCGVARMTDDELIALFDEFYPSRFQVQAHQNGDAAIDQFLLAARTAIEKYGQLDKRPIAIHCQIARPEQWLMFDELGVIPSLYPSTMPEQIEVVAKVVGDRINLHNACGTVEEAGVLWTSHNDAPLLLPDAMAMVDGAVNRRSRATGTAYATEVASSVYAALRSITASAAYQGFEEASKGTIEVGKLADLVVLDSDPLTVDPAAVGKVKVVETIKRGHSIYRAS